MLLLWSRAFEIQFHSISIRHRLRLHAYQWYHFIHEQSSRAFPNILITASEAFYKYPALKMEKSDQYKHENKPLRQNQREQYRKTICEERNIDCAVYSLSCYDKSYHEFFISSASESSEHLHALSFAAPFGRRLCSYWFFSCHSIWFFYWDFALSTLSSERRSHCTQCRLQGKDMNE